MLLPSNGRLHEEGESTSSRCDMHLGHAGESHVLRRTSTPGISEPAPPVPVETAALRCQAGLFGLPIPAETRRNRKGASGRRHTDVSHPTPPSTTPSSTPTPRKAKPNLLVRVEDGGEGGGEVGYERDGVWPISGNGKVGRCGVVRSTPW